MSSYKNNKRCLHCKAELLSRYPGLCDECEQISRRRREMMIPMSNGYRAKVIPAGYSDSLNNDDDN